MIKKIIKFIKQRFKEIILLIILLIILIALSSSILYEKNGSLSKVIMEVFSPITEKISMGKTNLVGERGVLKSDAEIEIENLSKENAKLRNELIKSKLTEEKINHLENLKGVLNFIDDKYDPNPISAKIIAKNDGKFFKTFTITAGKNNGIRESSIAMNEKGLIGRVYEASDNYSKVISLMDINANVSFEILESPKEKGVLNQQLNIEEDDSFIPGLINGYLFDINSTVKKGDTIITSGMGLYPEGIPIGKVSNIIKDKQNLLKFVQITPFVDFENLEIISIVNPREEQ